MMRLASGVDDSPIATRGCFDFSNSTAERPSLRAIMAMSEPANPEPITAMSNALCTRCIQSGTEQMRKAGIHGRTMDGVPRGRHGDGITGCIAWQRVSIAEIAAALTGFARQGR